MAGEIQFSFQAGQTCYVLIRNANGLVWNTNSLAFEVYSSGNYANYAISATQQGSSGFYIGTFPTQIVLGSYSIAAKEQVGVSVAESDPTIAGGNLEWNGTAVAPLGNAATSGQIAQIVPIKIYRGEQILNFPFKLVSSLDHVTPFTSGIVSGQISRDGGIFGALQSGVFTEVGLGWYKTNLTSGDLLANTAALVLSSVGISGGSSDNRDFGFILQRSSGSV